MGKPWAKHPSSKPRGGQGVPLERSSSLRNWAPEPLRQLWRLGRHGVFWARNQVARPHPSPVFVLGNQKSGTSAIAALLGHLTGLSTAIDLRREVGRQIYPTIVRGEISFDELIRRNRLDFSRAIVKEPNLTFFYDDLRERYPSSRFVFVVRHPADNLRSILNRLSIDGDLPKLEQRHRDNVDPGFDLVLNGAWMGLVSGSHYIDRLCARWNACCDVYLQNKQAFELIRYEDFVADKISSLTGLAEATDLAPRYDIRNQIDRPFQRSGQRDVDLADFFGINLRRITENCGEKMNSMGYPVGDHETALV